MADCNDLQSQIAELEKRLENIASTRRGVLAAAELDRQAAAKPKPRVLRTYTGQEIDADPAEWIAQAEFDAMAMGDEVVTRMVQAGFDESLGPNGTTGRMVNYAQLDPSDANIAALLEVMGLKRSATDKGLELRRPFTSQVAAQALMQMAQKTGANPRAVAEALSKRVKGIDNLPATVYMAAKARWDTASQYADVLDELADAIEGGYLTDDLKAQAANAARWAHFFEQFDAQIRTQVGRALRSLQFNGEAVITSIDLSKDIQKLTLDDVKGDTLVAQMLKQTAEGNAAELRRAAAGKRVSQMLGGEINDTGFYGSVRALNYFRRANLLSSVSSWLIRNPVAGALVQVTYMAEDSLSGTFRSINTNGLVPGTIDGLQAVGYAARGFQSAFGMAWGNAIDTFRTGKAVMGDGNPKYVTASISEDPKAFIDRYLGYSMDWKTLLGNPLMLFNGMNAAVWKVFGVAGEKLLDTDAGYALPFRLLSFGDEYLRTAGFAWKTHHEAFIRAAKEGRAAGKSIDWIEKRANEMTEKTIFDGVFSDDDLVEFRRARNEQQGIPPGEDLNDDELRALLYNRYHNAPNLSDELTQVGMERGDNLTFSRALRDPITGGVNQMRQNPLMEWAIPFWKVPINGLGWVLNRDFLIAMPKQLIMEGRQAASKGAQFTAEEMADARARTLVSAAIFATTYALWENGLFTDGGSFDVRQRERERRTHNPYAFILGGGVLGAGLQFAGNGIDVIDLMGLQADVMRGFHEGVIQQQDASAAAQRIAMSYANLLKNRAALKNLTSILNWAQDTSRYDFARVLGDQMGGIMPVSGLLGNITRTAGDQEERVAKRRTMTAEEAAALRKDPLFGPLQPVVELLKSAVIASNSNYPVLGALQPREKDWLGNRVERPFGISLDQTIPFMPVIKPKDRLYSWMERHGFGDKPRPDGKFEFQGNTVQMTNDEENIYREEMRTATGNVPPEQLGVSGGRLLPIWRYVQGQTMAGALRKLMDDPVYDRMLNTPQGKISPSLVAQPGKSLDDRKASGGGDLYAPVDDIIHYYDRLGLMGLMKQRAGFLDRFRSVVKLRQDNLQQYAEGLTPLGVGRQ